MHRSIRRNNLFPGLARKIVLLSVAMVVFVIAGCSVSTTTQTSTTTSNPQTYFAPYVVNGNASSPQTYTIDDAASAFSQQTFYLNPPTQVGSQVLNAGDFTVSSRGLLSLGIKATYVESLATDTYVANTFNPAEAGSFAVELSGQTAALVQLVGDQVQPLVAATECPNFTAAQTYQFVTIPKQEDGWDPTTDTAYGSVDIRSSGSTVNFKNIQQFMLPSVGGGSPAQPSASSVTGVCGSTTLGYITGVPGQYVVEEPGISNASAAQAAIGIGSTGLLVESNGTGSAAASSYGLTYNNVLGAGTGAVGLPKPSSDITSAVVGAQYLGFIYNAGENSLYLASDNTTGWSSHLASFGFSSVPSSCASVAASTKTLIYGGDFPVSTTTGLPDPNNSSNANYPYGNCDFAIDLGAQTNNGLYPNATVWVGTGYTAYATISTTYSFKAVAIAGQLNGKYAIFVLGVDSTQPWAVYLLQSN